MLFTEVILRTMVIKKRMFCRQTFVGIMMTMLTRGIDLSYFSCVIATNACFLLIILTNPKHILSQIIIKCKCKCYSIITYQNPLLLQNSSKCHCFSSKSASTAWKSSKRGPRWEWNAFISNENWFDKCRIAEKTCS